MGEGMSEFINNSEKNIGDSFQKESKKRIESLFQFSQGILKGEDGSKLIEKHKDALKHITPHDMIAMEEKQLRSGISTSAIKEKIEKVMNVIYDYLKKYEWEKPQDDHALYYFMQENRELEKILGILKQNLQDRDFESVKNNVAKLFFMEHHYLRKENILFPFLERNWENCRPLSVMWSIHDDIRLKLKALQAKLTENKDFNAEIFKLIGEVFFLMYGMIFKEELVIYPVAMETLSTIYWRKIQEQSFDIGFSYITPPVRNNLSDFETKKNIVDLAKAFFQTETGSLNQQQLKLILNTIT